MPTAANFRSAATNVRVAAGSAAMSANSVRGIDGNTGLVAGGTIMTAVLAGLAATQANADQLSGALHGAAAEFDRRAEICDAYTTAVRRWRVDHAAWQVRRSKMFADIDAGIGYRHPGPEPQEPPRVPLWVEES